MAVDRPARAGDRTRLIGLHTSEIKPRRFHCASVGFFVIGAQMKRMIAIITILILSTPLFLFAGDLSHGSVLRLAKDEALLLVQGEGLVFSRKYDEAHDLFKRMKVEFPASPAGCFGEMALLEIKMLEREDFSLERQFNEALKEGMDRVEEVLSKQDANPWELFISGSLIGLDGFFKARHGKWWAAYVAGNRSRNLFERVQKIDPDFVDVNFGLGMHTYWRSAYIHELPFLRMFSDKRDEGIAAIERVARDGSVSRDIAQANLIIIYIDEKRFKECLPVLDSFLARYPDSVLLHHYRGKVLSALGFYDDAIDEFNRELKIDATLKKPIYFINAALVKKGDLSRLEEAKAGLNKFIGHESSRYWPAAAHFYLGRIAELRGDAQMARSEFKVARDLNPNVDKSISRVRGMGAGL